jgi:transposase
MARQRTRYSAQFKAKVALEALREQETVAEIARRYKVHAGMVHKWRQQLLANLTRAFEAESGSTGQPSEREAELLKKIGELTVERDFLSNGLGRLR